MSLKKLNFLFIVVSIFAVVGQLRAQKTDTIYHINGNVLTGDLKKLNYGIISYKMDGMGTINFEEIKINAIVSKKLFEVKLFDGRVLFGSLDSSSIPTMVNIVTFNGRVPVNITDIVEMYPIKGNFWQRLSGNFGLGANYSKGSNITTIVFSGDLRFRKEKSYFNFTWSDNNTYEGKDLTATKTDVNFSWSRVIRNSWSAQIALEAYQNSELGTKMRTSLNPIGIRDISYNHWNRFYVGAGISLMREVPFSDEDVLDDIAGLVMVSWRIYKFTSPKINLKSDISYLPYFSEGGRQRLVINLNPTISVINNNFDIGFVSYLNLDSKPSTSAASKSDYGINVQLSYSFH